MESSLCVVQPIVMLLKKILDRLSSFRQKPESSISVSSKNPWTPVFTGETIFCKSIESVEERDGGGKKLLIINLGSTSTKVGIHEAGQMVISESLNHQSEELKEFKTIFDQYALRKKTILSILKKHIL